MSTFSAPARSIQSRTLSALKRELGIEKKHIDGGGNDWNSFGNVNGAAWAVGNGGVALNACKRGNSSDSREGNMIVQEKLHWKLGLRLQSYDSMILGPGEAKAPPSVRVCIILDGPSQGSSPPSSHDIWDHKGSTAGYTADTVYAYRKLTTTDKFKVLYDKVITLSAARLTRYSNDLDENRLFVQSPVEKYIEGHIDLKGLMTKYNQEGNDADNGSMTENRLFMYITHSDEGGSVVRVEYKFGYRLRFSG